MKAGWKLLLIGGFAGFIFAVSAFKKNEPTRFVDESIKLPQGFSASVYAANTGRARHMAVNSNGDLFIKRDRLRGANGILQLRDTNKDGVVDDTLSFGNFGGTGIAVKNGYLYASSDDDVFRYKLGADGKVTNPDAPEKIAVGLFRRGGHHASKSLALDNAGNIYVNIGAPSNICQEDSTKTNPCQWLVNAGGIWQFKADKLNQQQSDGVKYATGLRNVVGLDWNQEVNDLFVMQHGRDLLFQNFPQYFDQKAGAENPAEEMFRVRKGGDYGWPYCYFDNDKGKKLLNPEYGGDRQKEGICAEKDKSIVQFPGHLAPNALLFYTGNQFPARYKNGAFIAFHGSWNRPPEPQAGYFVVFVPFKNGLPTAKWEVFAEGFAGENINRATYRPCGLAQGADGSLYVSDDNKGNIWKVTYKK